ncbi:N-acetylglucosamine-6-phosphate deacetylase [Aerococcaceae bacterium NML190938]|nr:N-acetylglucosamine-6-phosphate deacetylase [Aerococcaceae bacterium NML190938]
MSRKLIKNASVYYDGAFHQRNVLVEDGVIRQITPYAIESTQVEIIDLAGKRLVPGFIDIHTHGGFNHDINASNATDLVDLSYGFASRGTTSFLMSLVTDESERIMDCIDSYHAFHQVEKKGANILGIHLEGPFLSHDYKGSMPEHLLTPFKLDLVQQFQERAQGAIRYITVAPEVEGVLENIPVLNGMGIRVSIGHSGASYETAMSAIENGAITCTHTFNAMGLFHQHRPAIMGAVLESDSVYCEAICDGRHLHPGTVRMLLKAKGWDKVIAITDSIMAAGLPDGRYKLGVNDIVVVDGDAKLAYADVRAGSTLTTIQALHNICKFTGESVEKVLPLLTENPAKMLGVFDQVGEIAVGKRADMVCLSEQNEVLFTMVHGEIVYQV